MKTFRRLIAGGLLVLLAVLFFSKAPRFRATQSPNPASVSSTLSKEAPHSSSNPQSPAVSTTSSQAASASAVSEPFPHDAFDRWARKFAQANPAERGGLLAEGEALAQSRREEMLNLIRSQPEEALRRALPYSVREQLPKHIREQIEQPISDRGSFFPVCLNVAHGLDEGAHLMAYEVFINGARYETHTYGGRLQMPARDSVYIHGVSVMDHEKNRPVLALSDDMLRRVEDESEKKQFIGKARVPAHGPCHTCNQSLPAADKTIVAEFSGKALLFCGPSHADQMEMVLKAAHGMLYASGGSSPAKNHAQENLPPQAFSGTQGIKKLLYIRVLFADDPIPPQSADGAESTAKANNQYFYEGSYGTVWWQSTITPLVRLPQRKNFYGENPGALLADAATGAAAFGYFTRDYYSPHYVLHNTLVQYDFGGLSSGILNASPGALTHELGHNFGLPHANFFQPEGSLPGPAQPAPPLPPYPIDPDSLIGHYDLNAPYILRLAGDQPVDEYGNQHDVMGSGGGHFSAMFKAQMNWLPPQYVKTISRSTTNRIFAFDTPSVSPGRLYAMRMIKDLRREYWFSYRQGHPNNPWYSSGIEVDFNLGGNNVLVDTTPGSTFGREDAALVVGRTLHDPAASLYVTPIAIGGGPAPSDKWIDVVVNVGTFPDNQAPTLAIEASALTIEPGETVTFSATAQDADGDTLAYYWDFGDWTFGTNGASQSKTFNTAGNFVARCEVSDLRGGMASRHVLITVGEPTTFTISGRVLDTEGNPVQGVRVHNSGAKPTDPPASPVGADTGTYRYSYTDTDGYYVIGNVPPGNYQARAFKFGYSTSPLNFTDPLDLNGNALEINFIATQIPRVGIAQKTDADEPAGETGAGTFTVTREGGDFSQDLPVNFTLSGTAIANRDYTILGANTLATNCVVITNGNERMTNCVEVSTNRGNIVIPAFVSSVDVQVVPIDNAFGDGDKTVTLTLLLQTNFFRVRTEVTNILTTNGSVIITNSMFVTRTNQFRVPGWELRPFGPAGAPTWFQTDPTYVLNQAEFTLNIQDDDPPNIPAVQVFALDSDTLESRQDTATLTFTRFGAPVDNDLVIHYEVSGQGVNGEDFTALPGVVTIPAGQQFVNVTVTAINDLFVEGNESVQVEILPSPNYFSFFGDSFMIVDDDLPEVNIYSAVSSVPRNGGAARVTVSRAGSTEEPLVVNYLVTGTAVSGVDYAGLSGSMTIPAGQLTADINVAPIAGSTNPLPRTVTIRLSDATTYNIYRQSSATITIIDNNLPTVTLARSTDAISESGGAATLTVTRTGPTTSSLNVLFDVGGSAWEGTDYASIGTNVVIPAGSATATININALNDNAREVGDVVGMETIIVRLRAHTNYNLGGTVSQSLTITDDENDESLPAVGFMLARSTVMENVGVAELFVKVTANPATNRPIQLEYRVTSGTAVPNVNYVNIFPHDTNGSLSSTGFLNILHYRPPNPPPQFFNFENGIYTIPVQILDDGVASGDKTLTITLFNPTRYVTNTSLATNMGTVYTNFLITAIRTNAYLGPAVSHTLTIRDLAAQTVSIAASTNRVYEAGQVGGQFIVTRTGPVNAPLTVSFALTGTAASGSDYAPLGSNGTVTIPAGTNRVAMQVIPLDDPTEEVAESIVLTLLPQAGYHVGVEVAQMLIVSDDGTLQFSLPNYEVAEDGGTASISVVRTGATNLQVSVDYLFLGGTALNGADFYGTNGTLTFAPGITVQSIPIPLVDDSYVEPVETISLMLSNATGGVPLGGQDTATVHILNDDTAFDFTTATFRGNENATTGQVIVRRSGVLTNAESVVLRATNGTASLADFVGGTFIVNFQPGESNQTASISILDDALFEGDETVLLSLTQPTPGTFIDGVTNAVLLLVDDECQIEFSAPTFSAIEYSNFVSVVVRRVGGTVNPIAVDYTMVEITATNGTDFLASNGTLVFTGDRYESDTNGSGVVSFQPGESSRTLLIPILDDVLGEGNETFTVTLSNPQTLVAAQSGSTLLGTNVSTTVVIVDNESPGQVDYEFTPGAGANGLVRSVSIAPAGGLAEFVGRVVIGGDFTTFDGIVMSRVARLLPNGTLDAGFNPGAGVNSNVWAVAVQPDGRVLIGGEFTAVNGTNRTRLARLNGDGKLDLGFDLGTNGVDATVRAIAVQPDGRVLIGGHFSQVSGASRGFIARLLANGQLDTSFNPNVNGPVHTIAVQADGRILIGGAFSLVDSSSRVGAARLLSSGSLDGSFNIGSGFAGQVNSIAIAADGKVVVGGGFSGFNGAAINNLVRLESSGLRDTTFNVGSGPGGVVHSVGVSSLGRVVIGGAFSTYNGVLRAGFARINANGTLDTLFNIGTGANAPVRSLVVQDNTAVVIAGEFTEVNGLPRNRVARIHGDEYLELGGVEFTAAEFTVPELEGAVATITVQRTGGNPDRSFSVGFLTADGTATASLDYTATNGVFSFAPGEMTKTFQVRVHGDELVEGNETVRLILTNAPASVTVGLPAVLVILDSARSVHFGAAEYTVSESQSNAVITVVRAGSLDDEVSVTLSTSNITAAAGYDYAGFTNVLTFGIGESLKTLSLPLISNDGEPELTETLLLRLSAPGNIAPSTPATAVLSIEDDDPGSGHADVRFDPAPGANAFVRSLALQADGKLLIGGAFTSFGGSGLNYAARLLTNGALDAAYAPGGAGPDALVSGLGVTPNGYIMLAGAFSNYNGSTYNRLIRLTSNGVPDVTFTSPLTFDAAINAGVVQADGRMIVGGNFKSPTAGIARIRANGTLDIQFNPGTGADAAVFALALQQDGKVILGGAFTNVNGSLRTRLARLGADGTLDNTFPFPGITSGIIYGVALAPGGKVLIAGNFQEVHGVPRRGVARLNPDGSLDVSFNPGTGAEGTVYTVCALTNGAVFIGGDFTQVNGVVRSRYALLRENGAIDMGFDSTAGANNTVYTSLVTPAQQIVIGGDFTLIGAQPRLGVARLNVLEPENITILRAQVVANSALIRINSTAGRAYVLEGSADLSYWLSLNTNLATSATLDFTDPNVTANGQRFYRARRFSP